MQQQGNNSSDFCLQGVFKVFDPNRNLSDSHEIWSYNLLVTLPTVPDPPITTQSCLYTLSWLLNLSVFVTSLNLHAACYNPAEKLETLAAPVLRIPAPDPTGCAGQARVTLLHNQLTKQTHAHKADVVREPDCTPSNY